MRVPSSVFALRTIRTPLAPLTLGVTERGVCLVEMGDPRRVSRALRELEVAYGEPGVERDHPMLDRLESELLGYLAGEHAAFTLPLDTPGTPWQRRVWDELLEIPYARTESYGSIARRLASPGSSRAVGLANARNRVSILIPCHRVIAADGSLHGYGGGLARKRWLLDHEQRHAPVTDDEPGLFGARSEPRESQRSR